MSLNQLEFSGCHLLVAPSPLNVARLTSGSDPLSIHGFHEEEFCKTILHVLLVGIKLQIFSWKEVEVSGSFYYIL